jgi:hypothetical protein
LRAERSLTTLADVVALERAVDLISEGFFDGHNVLFADSQKKLTSSHFANPPISLAFIDLHHLQT